MSAVGLLESTKCFYMLAINNNNKVQCVTAGTEKSEGIKGQATEGGSRAGMPETRCSANLLFRQSIRMINKSQISYRHWQKDKHATASWLEGLCLS